MNVKNAKHDDLIHVENGNLPEWANDEATTFWRSADKLERVNGSVYRELVIALPRELTPTQRLDLTRKFVAQEIGENHAYTFAIHCPKAALEGGDQPHVHIMYSERTLDSIERDRAQYFKRYNAKEPSKGGLKKACGGKHPMELKEALKAQRARWAGMQNKHLARLGHKARVTHRTLEAQGIKRNPAKHMPHLGVAGIAIQRKSKRSLRVKMLKERVYATVKAIKTKQDGELQTKIKRVRGRKNTVLDNWFIQTVLMAAFPYSVSLPCLDRMA